MIIPLILYCRFLLFFTTPVSIMLYHNILLYESENYEFKERNSRV